MSDMNNTSTGYIKVELDYAPKTNGKKFAEWCKKYNFAPIGSGRRAWCPSLQTYLRGASGVAFADGEMFLFDKEDLINLQSEKTKAVNDFADELLKYPEYQSFDQYNPDDWIETIKQLRNKK